MNCLLAVVKWIKSELVVLAFVVVRFVVVLSVFGGCSYRSRGCCPVYVWCVPSPTACLVVALLVQQGCCPVCAWCLRMDLGNWSEMRSIAGAAQRGESKIRGWSLAQKPDWYSVHFYTLFLWDIRHLRGHFFISPPSKFIFGNIWTFNNRSSVEVLFSHCFFI